MEIVAVAAIALIVFGPEKLPEIARTVGRTLSQLRRMADDVRDEFKDGLDFKVDDDDEEDDAPGPSPRRDHPNVRAAEAASAAKPAWEQAPGEETSPQEDFDPNYDIDPAKTAPGDQDGARGETEPPAHEQPPHEQPAHEQPVDPVGGEAHSKPDPGSGTGAPANTETEVDGPPGQRAG
jgi:Tat protein translocase TatB subunit